MADAGDDKDVSRLLDAVLHVTAGLDLSTVLERVVDAAVTLADARYGALGVLREDGTGLAEFIHTGFDPETAERIGHLPEGRGILGLLIEHPEPLRLRDLATHEASAGFPPHHPPMRSFLGAPIRVRSRAFGNLYLTDKQSADAFDAEDEQLVVGLAAVAGTAIENARLYDASQRREHWLDALRRITGRVIAGDDLDDVLGEIARRAGELIRADVVSIAVPSGPDTLVVRAAHGEGADALRGVAFGVAGSLSAEAMERRGPVLVADVAGDHRVHQPLVRLARVGPALIVPLARDGRAYGTVSIGRLRDGPSFTDEDLALVETFAGQASVALEYHHGRQRRDDVAVLTDRERIARELHDSAIQKLFAAGLDLEGTASRLQGDRPDVARRLEHTVAALDEVIRELRTTIFATAAPATRTTPADTVVAVAREAGRPLGFEPLVRLAGDVDATDLDADLLGHLAAVVRESLTNVARHAAATRVEVELEVATEVRVRVCDDGRGPAAEAGAGRGLRNLRARAGERGGRCDIRPATGGGTVVEWWVPR